MKTQTSLMKELILEYLKDGVTNNSEIYDRIEKDIDGIKRPTVRRCVVQLRNDLRTQIDNETSHQIKKEIRKKLLVLDRRGTKKATRRKN